MSGLFAKEFIVIMKNNKVSLLAIPLFLIVGIINKQFMFLMLIPALLSMLPLGTMTYDEISHWNLYVHSLPVNKKNIVTSKYGTVLILALISTVVTSAILFAIKSFYDEIDNNTIIFMTAASLLIGIIVPSVSIPINYKFGTSNGRVIYMIIVGMICVVFPSIILSDAKKLTGKIIELVNTPIILALATVGVVAVITLISLTISVKIYENKEE